METFSCVFVLFTVLKGIENNQLITWNNTKTQENVYVCMGRPLDYVHTVSFSLVFYIVLRPQGIRKQMKTLRKRHRVHIALEITADFNFEFYYR